MYAYRPDRALTSTSTARYSIERAEAELQHRMEPCTCVGGCVRTTEVIARVALSLCGTIDACIVDAA